MFCKTSGLKAKDKAAPLLKFIDGMRERARSMNVFEIVKITSVAMKSMADLYQTDISSKMLVVDFLPIFCDYLGFIGSFSVATRPPLSGWW